VYVASRTRRFFVARRVGLYYRFSAHADPNDEKTLWHEALDRDPVLNEERNVRALYDRLLAELQKVTADYELLFVDDGSSDASAELIRELHRADSHVN